MDDTFELVLSIFPERIAIDELHRCLSIETAFVGRRGDLLSSEGETRRKREVWRLTASPQMGCLDIDECWTLLESHISGRRSALTEVARVERVKLDLVVYATTGFPEIRLSSDTLSSIASYNFSLEVFVYADLAGANHEWEERMVDPTATKR